MQSPLNSAHADPGCTIRVLTYNVHSCVGADRRLDPDRIAEAIAACAPDVIALQELDVGRRRTGNVDQAEHIADRLRMMAHFHPALHVEEEKYGDAILTALPSRLVKAGALPSTGEPRGAIWVEVEIDGRPLQIVNTHLGLRRRERWLQVETLLGQAWTGGAEWRVKPGLLLGDFNAVPGSPAYRLISGRLQPLLSKTGGRPRPTFPSRLPLLRLDHVFANEHIRAVKIETIDTPLARRASDHLPLMATVEIMPISTEALRPQAQSHVQAVGS